MNIEEIREYCLAKPGVTEGFPFDETTLVFKVMKKMFALTGLNGVPPFVNLKCNPEKAIELRGEYEDIKPGWHMNKEQWNSVYFVNLPRELIEDLIDHSYELVLDSLPGKLKEELRKGGE